MEIRDERTDARFFVDNAVVFDYGQDLGPYGLAVYVALCAHAKRSTQACFPSHATLAREIGCGVAKVKEALGELRDLGLISITPRIGKEGQGSNIYTLLNVPARVQAETAGEREEAAAPQSPGDPGHHRYPAQVSVAATNNPNGTIRSKDSAPSAGIAEKPATTPEATPKSQRRALIGELADHFSAQSGQPKPEPQTTAQHKAAQVLWWGPLGEIADMAGLDPAKSRRLIDLALKQLAGLTVADPKSILRTARAIRYSRSPGGAPPQRGTDGVIRMPVAGGGNGGRKPE